MLRKMHVCSAVLCFLAFIGLLLCSCQSPVADPKVLIDLREVTVLVPQTVKVPVTVIMLQTVEVPVTIMVEASPHATVIPDGAATQTARPIPSLLPTSTSLPQPIFMPTSTTTLPPDTTWVVKGLMEALQAIADRFMPIGADSCELLYHTILGEIRLVGTQEDQVSQLLTITYPLTRIWDEKSALENCTYSFRQTAPELFSLDPYLDRAKFVYMATLNDKYGAESMGLLLWIEINREQADKIVWANLSECNIPLIVEQFRLDPSSSLRQAWTDLCP